MGGQDKVAIATGHWGCGAFGGNKYVKSLIQIMAACKANIHLVFHDITPVSCDVSQGIFVKKLCDFVVMLSQKNITVGQLFLAIIAKTKSVHCENQCVTTCLFDEIITCF